ncbi:hypothetical protein SeMB42_g05781 [Synchytrium endobioticum]|uniref:Uncharacterized protein n=1 Tax=Synchytrium endobioticum TaxID=286115 RepID=A0A507CPF2_9FUNG|nr:hypothetical protein SeMB42_g05781 [Synchytrium endobioticum]
MQILDEAVPKNMKEAMTLPQWNDRLEAIKIVRMIGAKVSDRCSRNGMDVYSAVVYLYVYKRCVTKYMNQYGCGVPT